MNPLDSIGTNLFLLEDSKELSAQVERLARRMGWRVIAARSLEEAERFLSKDGVMIHVALVDLMISKTDNELLEVEGLLARRETESEQLTKRGARTEAHLREVNARIDFIDKKIMGLIPDDGGLQLLKSEHGKAALAKSLVAIFTARRADSILKSSNEILESAVTSALGRPPEAWFEKPVSPWDLEQWLEEAKVRVRADHPD